MKNNNLFKIGGLVLMAILAVVSLFTMVAAGAGFLIATTGAVVTGAAVSESQVRAGSTLDKNHISKIVTEMRPAATPLDTILRRIDKSVTCKSFRTEYYAVDSRPLYDTVKTAFTSQGDGSNSYALVVNNISMWTVDDTCMFKGVTGGDSLDLVCAVTSKSTANETITIQPLNGIAGAGTKAGTLILPNIPISTRIVRLGPAKHEEDAQTTPYAIVPVKSDNYLQIFMCQVEESTFQSEHEKEVEYNFSDYSAQNVYNMKATMELSYLFGVKKLLVNLEDNKSRYSTGGITRFITKALTYGTGGVDRSIDNGTFVDWSKSIFTGNSGADTRVLFGGDGLMANLSKVDTVMKQIEANKTEVKWGITFRAIETNFGILLFKHHALLDYAGWGDNGIVLDMNNIERHVFKPMATRKLDLRESGQRNVNAVVIEETSGVVCRYPDTHAIIRPTT